MIESSRARRLLGIVGLTFVPLLLSTPSVYAASSLTIGAPGHGPVGQSFQATYAFARCSTSYVSFSWDGTVPGPGTILSTLACSSTSVTANNLTPPSVSAVGGHTVYGYFSDAAGNYSQDSASARYTVDAPANQPPTVTTVAANGITAYSATLKGTINPHGCTNPGGGVGWSFVVGTTLAYGLSGPTGYVTPADAIDDQVSGSQAGLTPSTLYHFKLTASGPCGSGQGSDLTFTTPAATIPTMTVTTLAATGITANSATLNGTINPHGCTAPGGGVGWSFVVGTNLAYGLAGPTGSASPTSTVDNATPGVQSGLTPNTLYHFKLTASGPCGSAQGTDMNFTTAVATALPMTVTSLAATNITAYTAALNGSINPQGCTAPGGGVGWSFVVGTTLQYGLTGTFGSVSPTSTVEKPVSGLQTGLAPNTLYHFKLTASGPCGSGQGIDLTFTTPVSTIPDMTVTTLAASNITQTSATLNGVINPQGCTAPGGGVGWSFVYGKTVSYGLTGGPVGSVSPPTVKVDTPIGGGLSGLTANTTYHIKLTASGPCGSGQGKDMTFTTSGDVVLKMLIIGGGLAGLGALGFAGFKLGWLGKILP